MESSKVKYVSSEASQNASSLGVDKALTCLMKQ